MRNRIGLTGTLLLCVFIAGIGCPLSAPMLRLVFNQGTCGDTAGYSESDYSDFFGGEQQLGDDFELTAPTSTVTLVKWWGAYRDDDPVTDDFTLTVFRDNGTGMPDTGGYWEWRAGDVVNRTATTMRIAPATWDLTVYEYSCEVEGWVGMEPGEKYFLSIVNDTGKWMWCDNGSASEGNNFGVAREGWGDDWGSNAVDMAFQLWSNEALWPPGIWEK
ncbi:MAG TPA: hypothetical protein PLM14_06850 [Candidatus Hydrogenedentes bacterium]|nr:hypothetical protein [Candidatus Hydrogenedentota bacterium]HQE82703.1 hypothetical protein [Candidatus Hydrogenedentota bacterium]HQM48597.1 hypothetical protein [Candidatus Hydrogenedentota bacterium]